MNKGCGGCIYLRGKDYKICVQTMEWRNGNDPACENYKTEFDIDDEYNKRFYKAIAKAEEQLKPCPFCGEQPTLKPDALFTRPDKYLIISCDNCHIAMGGENGITDIAVRWNKRCNNE